MCILFLKWIYYRANDKLYSPVSVKKGMNKTINFLSFFPPIFVKGVTYLPKARRSIIN